MGVVASHSVSTFASPVNGTTPIDANTVRGNDNTIKTAYNAHDADTTIHLQNGAISSRPAASTLGQMWLATDTGAVVGSYDTGAAWVAWNYVVTASTGAVTITSTTSPQLTVAYDGSHSATFGVSSAGLLTINATTTVTITPATTITGATTLSAALTYGGVTLSNAVTGTGNMVLSASPTFTGTITAAVANFSGLVSASVASGAAFSAGTATMTQPVKIGEVSDSALYGTLTFNNAFTSAGLLGIQARGSTDLNLYFNTATSGQFKFQTNGAANIIFNAGAVSGITTLAGTGAVSGFTTAVFSSTVTIGAATNPIQINRVSDSTTYGAISFNGSFSSAGLMGFQARVNGAEGMYYATPAGTVHQFLTAGVTTIAFTGGAVSGVTTLAASAQIRAGGAAATSAGIGFVTKGIDGATSSITATFNSGSNGAPSFIHFTDSFTWNAVFGANAAAGFEWYTGRFPGTAGTLLATLNSTGSFGIGGTVPSGGGVGIAYPAAQSASTDVNTLDDYEEGSWTPSVGGSATYTTQTGRYRKVGKTVAFWGNLQINTIGSGSIGTVSGLPFASATGNFQMFPIGYFATSTTNTAYMAGSIASGASAFTIIGQAAIDGSAETINIFQNGTIIYFAGEYEAAN